MPLIQFIEFAALLAAAAWYGRRHLRIPAAPVVHVTQVLLGIAGYVLATVLWVILASNVDGIGRTRVGPATLAQLLRAAALFIAFLGTLSLTLPHLKARKIRWIPALLATWLAGGVGGGAGVLGFFVLLVVLRKAAWPQEIHGWRRALGLVLVPLGILGLFMLPVTTITPVGADVGFSPDPDDWPAPLLVGALGPAAVIEMGLLRPLDYMVSLMRAPLLAQLILVAIQFLTLPVKLRGVGLRRRLTINYFFVRIVPATLGILSFLLAAWAGFGLHKAAMVRAAFETTVERGSEAAVRRAEAADSLAGLAEARLALGPDGPRAHVLVRTPGGVQASSGTPDSLRLAAMADSVTRRTDGGLVAVGGTLWLRARAHAAGDTTRRADVYVPLDSLYLSRLAARRHVDIRVTANPDLFIGPTSVTTGSDTTWTSRPIAARGVYQPPPVSPGVFQRRIVLGRSFLPVGNWLARKERDMSGAVTLHLRMAPSYVVPDRREMVILLAGNAWTIGILLLVILVVSLTEGMAVRTGRGILNALFDDVSALRDAAQRFGKGDLDHRLPVHGNDEIATVARAFNEMATSLKAQQGELVEKKRLEADLALARDIQKRMLPQAPPVVSGVDLAGVSIPSLEVGGDLFAFFNEGPRRLGLALGDVSGKSVPAAILMSNTLAALRAESELAGAAGESLARLNRILIQQFESGRFVTLVYALLDPTTGALEFSSAGHNPALLVTAAGVAEWLPASGPPLGVVPDATYEPIRRTLASGDVLVLYSDGITEAARPLPGRSSAVARPEEMEFFDDERLAEVVSRLHGESALAIMDGVLSAVREFSGEEPQGDDITLLVVRYTGAPAASGPADAFSQPGSAASG